MGGILLALAIFVGIPTFLNYLDERDKEKRRDKERQRASEELESRRAELVSKGIVVRESAASLSDDEVRGLHRQLRESERTPEQKKADEEHRARLAARERKREYAIAKSKQEFGELYALVDVCQSVPEKRLLASIVRIGGFLWQVKDGYPRKDSRRTSKWVGAILYRNDPTFPCVEVQKNVSLETTVITRTLIRADFFIRRANLIVEVDGAAFHDGDKDQKRGALCAAHGIRVVRFPAKAVIQNPNAVARRILSYIEEADIPF